VRSGGKTNIGWTAAVVVVVVVVAAVVAIRVLTRNGEKEKKNGPRMNQLVVVVVVAVVNVCLSSFFVHSEDSRHVIDDYAHVSHSSSSSHARLISSSSKLSLGME
jgi:uncharacterized membrane protein